MARSLLFSLVLVSVTGLNTLAPGSQKSKRKKVSEKLEKPLPDVSELVHSRAFSAMKATVEELEKRLSEDQHRSVDDLKNLKANYEKKLILQRKNNTLVEQDNMMIASRLQSTQKKNNALRKRAANFMAANNLLRNELNALSSNLSLAQEFVRDGLAASATNATEVHVLSELAEADDVARALSKKQSLLGEFGHVRALSLIASDGDAHERSADDIMGALSQSLAKLSFDANSSQSALKAAFEKQLLDSIEKHESLMKDQNSLNKTNTDANDLHNRLLSAVKHLSEIHDHLVARIKAVKAFALRLSNVGKEEDASLQKPVKDDKRRSPKRDSRRSEKTPHNRSKH